MNNELSKLASHAQLDQAAEGNANMARMVVAYWHALHDGDIPTEIAAELVLEYNKQLWEHVFRGANAANSK
jgi:hypothetical protein